MGCAASSVALSRVATKKGYTQVSEFTFTRRPEYFANPFAYFRVMLTPNSTPEVAVSRYAPEARR